eukprot:6469929-Amphidinium_carterae.1
MTLRGSLKTKQRLRTTQSVSEMPESNKLEMQPPATDREITQKEKRDEKVAKWHGKVLAKPGVERVDWPDGFP